MSAIPQIEEGIIETLEGWSALEGTAISRDAEPTRPVAYIWLYKTESTAEFAELGGTAVYEMISAHIRVRVIGKVPYARTEAQAIAAEVTKALQTKERLGPQVLFQRVANRSDEQVSFDDKSGFHVLMTLIAKARI